MGTGHAARADSAVTDVVELVRAAADRLADVGLPTPRVDAELLAEHVLQVPRGWLALGGEVGRERRAEYDAAVTRRCAHEPLQHITGVAYFRRLRLAVGPGVFVPRPETEVMVDWVLAELARTEQPALVVDLCAGTGAIALSVATERPGVRVDAVEADEDAYRWLCRNVADTPAVRPHHADMVSWQPPLLEKVDLVVANPPYVPSGAALPRDVQHDPGTALYAGDDGLDGVRRVARAASKLLRPAGALAIEHDASHGESAQEVLRGLGGWTGIRGHHDLAGRPRFVTARLA